METVEQLRRRISRQIPKLSPQLRKAAGFVISHPADVATRSMRRVAGQAGVAPATMMRLSRAFGHAGYESFREPFRRALEGGTAAFGERARQLQSRAAASGDAIQDALREAQIGNITRAFAENPSASVIAAARLLLDSQTVYVLGLRSAYGVAHYLRYVLGIALPRVVLLRGEAGQLIDEAERLESRDVLVVVAANPYTRETVEAARAGGQTGASVLVLTDVPDSPFASMATITLTAPTSTPQFFPSMAALASIAESLIAAVVARGGEGVVRRIDEHAHRRARRGSYWGTEARRTGRPKDRRPG